MNFLSAIEPFLPWIVAALVILTLFAVLLVIVKLPRNYASLVVTAVRGEFKEIRSETAESGRLLRQEVTQSHRQSNDSLVKTIGEMGRQQSQLLENFQGRIQALSDANQRQLKESRETLERKMRELQEGNEKKLDQMRQTVDEKLQSTLEKRLGESFKLVSERLEAVQRGLGEMQELASGVGDLKRILVNVKTRGIWGEVQLAAILEQILTPTQYQANVQPKPGSQATVEFAIKLPGRDTSNEPVWLPVDAKFPREDYERLLDASEKGDKLLVEAAVKALTNRVIAEAKDISEKYLAPPHTTDFAIMFLPTEGLYAEIVRQPALVERLQNDFRVVITGPTTFAAILNSLRMGFRTLAISKQSSEVWKVLAAVKVEFGKFGGVLDKMKKQVSAVANTLEETGRRTRAMERKLQTVEELPEESAAEKLLGLDEYGSAEDDLDVSDEAPE